MNRTPVFDRVQPVNATPVCGSKSRCSLNASAGVFPGPSNGPTEAINGRLEHLRGSALGFRKPHQLRRPITTRNRRQDLDVSDAIFACPDLTTFCRLDELGLEVVRQRLEPDRAVLACRVVAPDQWCGRCGCEGVARDTVVRRLAHEPLGWRPTTLEVTVRRSRCTGSVHVWRQDTTRAANPRGKLSRRGLRWALARALVEAN